MASSTKDALHQRVFAEIHGSLNARPEDEIRWFDYFGYRDEEPAEPENPYWALSNFYREEPFTSPFLPGWIWPTAEHLFHFFKAQTLSDARLIAEAPTPDEAKAIGRQVPMDVARWDSVAYDAMAFTVRTKFALPSYKASQVLLGTGDAYLEEGTWWGDGKWGVELDRDGQPGRNWLGTLLMTRRAELRAGAEFITARIARENLRVLLKDMPFINVS